MGEKTTVNKKCMENALDFIRDNSRVADAGKTLIDSEVRGLSTSTDVLIGNLATEQYKNS